ncbi:hypothetical protein H6P81_018504 [Aristolochia fimbriata]|uniref:GCK domain-containing protein n=1 Tax=Aristolochia fimbriata TaxID=158543 RepID=A0AAV7E195_ARIFI|nr:hypothetical protein H6P81_018504 [Aristolochia fimbriata]
MSSPLAEEPKSDAPGEQAAATSVPGSSDQSDTSKGEAERRGDEAGEGEEEEGECGFCLFMKGGACREVFIAWENCVDEAEKNKENMVEKCFEITGKLKQCMDANADYYDPILRAEKAMEEEAERQVMEEAAQRSGTEAVEGSEKEPAQETK